jgi:hypothetical protein
VELQNPKAPRDAAALELVLALLPLAANVANLLGLLLLALLLLLGLREQMGVSEIEHSAKEAPTKAPH